MGSKVKLFIILRFYSVEEKTVWAVKVFVGVNLTKLCSLCRIQYMGNAQLFAFLRVTRQCIVTCNTVQYMICLSASVDLLMVYRELICQKTEQII